MGQSQPFSRLAGWIYGAPEGLPALRDVEVLQPGVLRVLGQNPGPATLQGTNTYLLGTGTERILVDTSDGNVHWWPLLLRALEEQHAIVSDVVLTHRHYDHVGGMEAVRESFPKAHFWKGPDSFDQAFGGSAAADEAPEPDRQEYQWLLEGDTAPPPPPPPEATATARHRTRQRTLRWPSQPLGKRAGRCWCGGEVQMDCKRLVEDQVIAVEGAALRVMLTPGHSSDSACLVLETPGRAQDGPAALLTGDTVLGGVAGRFDDLQAYTASLRHLHSRLREHPMALYPGHGAEVVADSAASYVRSLLDSLDRRERAIRDVLRSGESWSADEVCGALYGSGTSASMAFEMVQQHLGLLVYKGLARETPGWLLGPSTFRTLEEPLAVVGQDGWS